MKRFETKSVIDFTELIVRRRFILKSVMAIIER